MLTIAWHIYHLDIAFFWNPIKWRLAPSVNITVLTDAAFLYPLWISPARPAPPRDEH